MALTMRQQMAKGSKWKVKSDFTAENFSGAKFKKVPKPTPRFPNDYDLVKASQHMTDFTAGMIFTVTDKSSTSAPHYYDNTTGLFIPIEVAGKGKGVFLLKDLQDYVVLEEAVEQLIYAFWSPSHNKYIGKIPYSDYHDPDEWESAQKTGGIHFVDKLTEAMKKKRSQDTKQFLLSHSGYYDDIDTSDIYYVFEPGGPKVDFPDDLEVHTIDKATKAVKDKYMAKDYLAEAFRLRPLTIKYGSSIRAVFKEMEAKGKDYTTLLMFQDPDEDVYADEPSKKVKALKDEFKDQKLEKGTYIMKSDHRTVAFAFKNRSAAVMFRLQYSGDLQSKIVDSETLDEVKAS